MKKALEDKLFDKYPKIFAQKDDDPKKTAMCWGIECGDGWYWLLDNLCNHLQSHIDNNGYGQIEALQVKEKFGGLRFYTKGADRRQNACIRFAERLSMGICESCGLIGSVTQAKSGLITTRCKQCIETHDTKGS